MRLGARIGSCDYGPADLVADRYALFVKLPSLILRIVVDTAEMCDLRVGSIFKRSNDAEPEFEINLPLTTEGKLKVGCCQTDLMCQRDD